MKAVKVSGIVAVGWLDHYDLLYGLLSALAPAEELSEILSAEIDADLVEVRFGFHRSSYEFPGTRVFDQDGIFWLPNDNHRKEDYL